MKQQDSKEPFDEHPFEPDTMDTQEGKNLLEELQILDQKNAAFKKTTYWHQQASSVESLNTEALKDITEQLVKIEDKLTKIVALLERS